MRRVGYMCAVFSKCFFFYFLIFKTRQGKREKCKKKQVARGDKELKIYSIIILTLLKIVVHLYIFFFTKNITILNFQIDNISKHLVSN